MALVVHDIIIQILGIIGFIFGVIAYLMKRDEFLKAMVGVSAGMMAIHFFLLGSMPGMGAAGLTSIRSFCSIIGRVKPFAPIFFFMYLPLGYFTVHGWLDLVPLAAGLTGTFAMFYLKEVPMRLALLVVTTLWLVHNALHYSIGGVLLEVFIISANLWTMSRMYIEHKKNSDRPIIPNM